MKLWKWIADRLPNYHGGVGCGLVYCMHLTQRGADICQEKREARINAEFEDAGFDLKTHEFIGGPARTSEELERRRSFREAHHLPPSKGDDTYYERGTTRSIVEGMGC